MKEFEKWKVENQTLIKRLCEVMNRQEAVEAGAEQAWRDALNKAQEIIIERLKLVSYDDNIGCVRNIQEDIRRELGDPPEGCTRDGYRDICKQCPDKEPCMKLSGEQEC